MFGATNESCDLAYREVVDISQREDDSMVWSKLAEHLARLGEIEVLVPLADFVDRVDCRERALLAGLASPVIDQLVSCDCDQPRRREFSWPSVADSACRRHEGFGGEILSEARVATPMPQVAVHLLEGTVVQLNEAAHLPSGGIAHI